MIWNKVYAAARAHVTLQIQIYCFSSIWTAGNRREHQRLRRNRYGQLVFQLSKMALSQKPVNQMTSWL